MIPMKRISALLRRFDHVFTCLQGHPSSEALFSRDSEPFPAW